MAAKALIFSLAYYPRLVGGAEVAVKEITDRISPGDIEFHMVTLRAEAGEPDVEKIGNVVVHRIGFAATSGFRMMVAKHLYIFLAPFRASRLHCSLRFSFSWSIMASYAGAAGLLFKLTKPNVPSLLTLQEGDPLDYILGLRRVRPFLPLFKMIFKRADMIQVISNHLAGFARSMGAQSEIVVVPNGVDVEKFSRKVSHDRIVETRNEAGAKKGDLVIVTASRLVEKNAVGDIVASLTFLPAHVRLLVLGSGELEGRLRAQVARLGLSERVVFKGYVPHDDLPRYLQASDVFVRPSLSEGFGNSFIEAMAAGIPVVATPVGGIVDFLSDKETGLFCAVGDPQDLARKVEVAFRDRALRDEIVDKALRMVREKYDWNTVAREMRERAFAILKP